MTRVKHDFGSSGIAGGAVLLALLSPTGAFAQTAGTSLPPVTVDSPRVRIARPVVRRPTPVAQAARLPVSRRSSEPQRAAATVSAARAPTATAASAQPSETATGPVSGYVAHRSATGTKTNSSLLENPQSVTIVTKDQIEAQGARSVAESLRYEPGVVPEARIGDRFDSVFIRGFGGFGANANYAHFWDNLRLQRGVSYANPSVDPYLLERVEVLRGPASVLYGQNNIGGLVNLVSKEPLALPYHELLVRGGDPRRIEGGFDLSGPMNERGDLLYRVIGLARKASTEVDYNKTERVLVAPMMTWQPTAATKLTVRATYDNDPYSFQPNWVPAYGSLQINPLGQLGRNRFVGNPYFNTYKRTQGSVGYSFEHAFSESLLVRQNFRFLHVDSDFKALSVTGYGAGNTCGFPGVSNLCLVRTSTNYLEQLNGTTLDNQVQAKFDTGPFRHTVLAGLDHQYTAANATFGNGTSTNIAYQIPVYGFVATPLLTTQTEQRRSQIGLYAQDQIRFGNLATVFGVRHDWSRSTSLNRTVATGLPTNFVVPTDEATTWRAGATYITDFGLAPYISYSTSFEPALGTTYDGRAFVPTKGRQGEVGIKYQPAFVNAYLLMSLYDIRQQNVLTTDTANLAARNPLCTQSGLYCQTQTGEVHSRGFEISGKATLDWGLDLIAAYSINDIRVSKSAQIVTNISVQGKIPVGAPHYTASFWANYTVQDGTFRGLGAGAGVRYVSYSYGDNINSATLVVPGYTLYDAALHYDFASLTPKLAGFRFDLNASNVFDKKYVSACASSVQCFYGAGRNVLASLRYRW